MGDFSIGGDLRFAQQLRQQLEPYKQVLDLMRALGADPKMIQALNGQINQVEGNIGKAFGLETPGGRTISPNERADLTGQMGKVRDFPFDRVRFAGDDYDGD